ncbi:unnamed protein product [Pylaiella littoralis]
MDIWCEVQFARVWVLCGEVWALGRVIWCGLWAVALGRIREKGSGPGVWRPWACSLGRRWAELDRLIRSTEATRLLWWRTQSFKKKRPTTYTKHVTPRIDPQCSRTMISVELQLMNKRSHAAASTSNTSHGYDSGIPLNGTPLQCPVQNVSLVCNLQRRFGPRNLALCPLRWGCGALFFEDDVITFPY